MIALSAKGRSAIRERESGSAMQTRDKDSPADRFRRQVPGMVIAVVVTAIGITFLAEPEPSPPVRADDPGRLTALAFERTTIRARTSGSASSPAGSPTEVSAPGDVIGAGTATETSQPPAAPETTAIAPPDPPPGNSTDPSVGAGFSATASFSVEATFSVQLTATTTTPSTTTVTSTPLPTTTTITTTTAPPRTTTTPIPASATTTPSVSTTPSPTEK
ncbi:hypothetical protein [Nocardia sp. NPDC057227]|uniref:hypothetical protein n=1 Tax=Nocardia sp. NPDC057227 TaxID=3346056 RepID=UPI003638159F